MHVGSRWSSRFEDGDYCCCVPRMRCCSRPQPNAPLVVPCRGTTAVRFSQERECRPKQALQHTNTHLQPLVQVGIQQLITYLIKVHLAQPLVHSKASWQGGLAAGVYPKHPRFFQPQLGRFRRDRRDPAYATDRKWYRCLVLCSLRPQCLVGAASLAVKQLGARIGQSALRGLVFHKHRYVHQYSRLYAEPPVRPCGTVARLQDARPWCGQHKAKEGESVGSLLCCIQKSFFATLSRAVLASQLATRAS